MDDDEDVGPDLSAARDALLAEFLRVFPTRRPEPFPPLVDNLHSSDAVQAAAAFAEARDWTSLDGEWLHAVPNTDNGLTTARCFLSNAALRFYLPAYLTASLKLQLDPMHTVTLGFDVRTRDALIDEARPERGSWGAYARTRWADLTPGQVRAVARFMEWHVALDERCIEVTRGLSRHRDTAEALAYYWAPRAAGF
ncbi:DUF6714 family protein [Methylobacterium sp. WL6]|uniref:DUF6714 family protein n=1 Tax=Methylobacterium sp. WL6 TaxID=2603901 RepID=UPI0011CBD2AE|nr:DUF6714 family protein [Methylobacterium sp. WL6]TXN70469.1 hypothetical protein FV230_10460 [Methylobacterium sp. WL6]